MNIVNVLWTAYNVLPAIFMAVKNGLLLLQN